MGGVGEGRHDLIAGELIIFLDLFNLVSCGKPTEYGCYIDPSPLDAGLTKANRRVHCDARINLHKSLHTKILYPIKLAECYPSLLF